jgi:hypothetical protein
MPRRGVFLQKCSPKCLRNGRKTCLYARTCSFLSSLWEMATCCRLRSSYIEFPLHPLEGKQANLDQPLKCQTDHRNRSYKIPFYNVRKVVAAFWKYDCISSHHLLFPVIFYVEFSETLYCSVLVKRPNICQTGILSRFVQKVSDSDAAVG